MRPKAKTLWGLIAGAMATALIVAACGGGDPTPTPRPTATSAPPTAVPTATTRPQPTNTPVPGREAHLDSNADPSAYLNATASGPRAQARRHLQDAGLS